MKKFTFLFILFLGFVSISLFAQKVEQTPRIDADTVDWLHYIDGVNASSLVTVYTAPKAIEPPEIDGDTLDQIWGDAEWMYLQVIEDFGGDFDNPDDSLAHAENWYWQGMEDYTLRYKLAWDDETYYCIMQIIDDNVQYSDWHDYGQMWDSEDTLTWDFPWRYPPDKPTQGNVNAGLGDGTEFDNWRCDALEFYLMPPDIEVINKATRIKDTLRMMYRNVFPGAANPDLTSAEYAVMVLDWAKWTNANRAIEQAGYVDGDNTFIEWSGDTWANNWLPAPEVGDTLLNEIMMNETDTITNIRQYRGYVCNVPFKTGYAPRQNDLIDQWLKVILGPEIDHTGVTSYREETFSIYPNPNATGILNLSRQSDVSIFNINGKLIRSAERTSSIDISDLMPGIYLVKDNVGNVRKLVKK